MCPGSPVGVFLVPGGAACIIIVSDYRHRGGFRVGTFEQLREHDFGDVHFCCVDGIQLRAIVAIHDTRLGPALGGCRFVEYQDEGAALTDALRLARAMTSKAALAGLAHGGGKAVIMKPSGSFDRSDIFQAFAGFVDSLGGRYITTEDSGTGIDDMQLVRGLTKHVAGFSVEAGGSGDPSPFTALGVRRGIEAMVKVSLGRSDLEGLHVAVQGVGHVGRSLCEELVGAGARLTVADVRESLAQEVAEELGAETTTAARIHQVECDVYAPCALGGALNDRTVPELRCKLVAGAANNQLAADRNGDMLLQRGIAYAPDYAINAGGLINVAQEVIGYDAEIARERTLLVYDTILQIAQRAISESTPAQRIADALVAEKLARAS